MAWTVQYEASALPQNSTPQWAKSGTTTTEEIVSGELHVNSGINQYEYDLEGTNFSQSTGYTLRIKTRVISVEAEGNYQIALDDDVSYFALDFTSTAISIDQQYISESTQSYSVDTSVDHVYTMTVKDGRISVFVDGVLGILATLDNTDGGAGGNIYWGAVYGPSSTATETYTDYFYYDTSGAYVPENTWHIMYEATATPQNSNLEWVKNANPSTEEISPAGYLHLVSGTNGSAYSITDNDIAVSGTTIEIRMKVISGGAVCDYEGNFENQCSGMSINAYGDPNTANCNFYIYSDAVVIEGPGDIDPDNYDIYSLDTSEYHTYRITITDTTVNLYVDGTLRGTVPPYLTAGDGIVAFFPDVMGITGVETSWDYVYVNFNGANAPANGPVYRPMVTSVRA